MIRVVSLRSTSSEPRSDDRETGIGAAFETVVASGWAEAERVLEEDDVLVVTAPDLPVPDWVGERARARLVLALGEAAAFRGALPPSIPVISDASGLSAVLALLVRQDAATRALGRHVTDLDRLIDANPDAVILTDLDGKVLRANKIADAMFAGADGGLLGEHMVFAVSADGIGQLEVVHGDRVRIGEIRLADIEWNGQPAKLAAVRDVTVTAELQDRLAQSQKSDAIRLMAGGIAHEFNNMLHVAMSNLYFLRPHVGGDEPTALLDKADRIIERATALAQQMLVLSQSHVSKTTPVDLNALVLEHMPILRSTVPSTIELIAKPGEVRQPVVVDQEEIRQVLTNLVLNAMSATEAGGTITVSCDTKAGPPGGAAPQGQAGVRWCAFTVSDTGAGIAPGNLQRIFDPFFTTKPVGEGQGLGLAISRGYVKKAGGVIDVASVEGEGTSVTVYLPQAEEKAEAAEPRTANGNGSAHVLLLEDDPDVAGVLRKVLERAGFKVTQREDGLAGKQILERDTSIDVVVSDIVMPRLDGRDLAEWVVRARPSLRLLLITGYAERAEWLEEIKNETRDYLMKPFPPTALLSSVRRLLSVEV